MPVPSPLPGIVKEVITKQGNEVKQGDLLFLLESNQQDQSQKNPEENPKDETVANETVANKKQNEKPKKADAKSIAKKIMSLPDMGDGVEKGTVINILAQLGSEVKEGETLVEVETDKAVLPVPSSVSGKLEEILIKEGEEVKVGDYLFAFFIRPKW